MGTYYEEICIDKTNIVEHNLSPVNQQVRNINEKIEKDEEKKQKEMIMNSKNMHTLSVGDNDGNKENSAMIGNKKSFKYADVRSYSNGISSSSCSSLFETNNNNSTSNCILTSTNVKVDDDNDEARKVNGEVRNVN